MKQIITFQIETENPEEDTLRQVFKLFKDNLISIEVSGKNKTSRFKQ